MNSDNLLLTIAVVAVVVSAVGVGFTYYTVGEFQSWLTGLATSNDNATVNLTIQSTTSINFTTDSIDWGSGQVDLGSVQAVLTTSSGGGIVDNGTWTLSGSTGLVLENIGNTNVSLQLATTKNATEFLGNSSLSLYQFNVTEKETGSCETSSGTASLNTWYDVNKTTDGTLVCNGFLPGNSNDEVYIDIRLRIASDVEEALLGSELSDTVIATATSN